MPDGEKPLTEAGAKVVAKEIMENVGNGWNTQAVAVEEFIGADDDKDYCPFYIGYTRRGLYIAPDLLVTYILLVT